MIACKYGDRGCNLYINIFVFPSIQIWDLPQMKILLILHSKGLLRGTHEFLNSLIGKQHFPFGPLFY